MTGEDAEQYLEHEWEAGANGPDKWDCWHFLRHVMKEHFGKDMPRAPIGDVVACRAIYDEEVRLGHWKRVLDPQHGDAVSMREGDWPHVGIYLDVDGGKILHCCEGHGVIAQKPSSLKLMGFGRIKFYRVTN